MIFNIDHFQAGNTQYLTLCTKQFVNNLHFFSILFQNFTAVNFKV